MPKHLTCPVCGYYPIESPLTFADEQELEKLAKTLVFRNKKTSGKPFKVPLDTPLWIQVQCPNHDGAFGTHGFRFNRQTGETTP